MYYSMCIRYLLCVQLVAFLPFYTLFKGFRGHLEAMGFDVADSPLLNM